MDIQHILKNVIRTLDRHSPIILTGIGVAGVLTTTALAVRATPEAYDRIRDYESKDNGFWIKSTVWERVKLVWPLYVPAAGSLVLTSVAIIGAQSINSRRQAVLLSGITVAERALTEYQDKVVEIDGPRKDQKIRDAIIKDHIDQQPPSSSELILPAGEVLCYDDYSGRYFHSTMEKIQQAKNEVNALMINGEDYASLNTFYGQLGLKGTKVGEEVGWSTQNLIDINFTSQLTEEGVPVLAMGFRVLPLQDYYNFR